MNSTLVDPTLHSVSSLLLQKAIRASASVRARTSSFATIPPTNVPTFTTDHPSSPWLSSSLSPRLLPPTPAPPALDFSYPPTADFELFPSPSLPHPAPSATPPRPRAHVTPTPHPVPRRSGGLRRDSTTPAHPSPLSTQLDWSPHVNIHSSSSDEQRISPAAAAQSTAIVERQPFYASSAPASSAALPHQTRSASISARPPVPLFHSNSTGNVQRSVSDTKMASSHQATSGTTMIEDRSIARVRSLTRSHASTEMNALFDLPGTPGVDLERSASEAAFMNAHLLDSPFTGLPDAVDFLAQSTPATISPSELMRDPVASVPPSAAFTNLTSPSNFGSPEFAESFETSPMFAGEGGATDLMNDNWFPLFAGETAIGLDESPLEGSTDDLVEPVTGGLPDVLAPRRRSSQFDSPRPRQASLGKPSSVSGVSARKRDRPLPPIRVENPNDSVALKRARNTMAARKSRQRKLERVEELERTIEDLRDEVTHWKTLALGQHPGLSGA
ncbi:MAG: hypothetical protein M1823_000761 [Watsoniomyces obsoletus]|nr:MAG: hypothetical protein M1823_000761 [Watsoniomyces obsoletus]